MEQPIVIAFIQARMGSSRFPGKVMQMIGGGKTVLQTTCERVKAANEVDHVVVITSTNPADDIISRHCAALSIMCFRGSEEDVMQRLVDASLMFVCDIIVDVTSDCPLVDPLHIDHLVKALKREGDSILDYASNVVTRTWPDGLDVQVYKKASLIKLVENYEINCEHTGWNFIRHKNNFNWYNFAAPVEYRNPDWALTLDHPEDLDLLKLLFYVGNLLEDEMYILGNAFRVELILDFLKTFPWIMKVNQEKDRKAISHETFHDDMVDSTLLVFGILSPKPIPKEGHDL